MLHTLSAHKVLKVLESVTCLASSFGKTTSKEAGLTGKKDNCSGCVVNNLKPVFMFVSCGSSNNSPKIKSKVCNDIIAQ